MIDTIVALSSGRPPAAIAVMRVSGPRALAAAGALAGDLPPPRRASLRALRDADGTLLDRALVLVFPGPDSATGEDVVEIHCHAGKAVLAAVTGALIVMAGVRHAEPGEFTRRALTNGRIDLTQAEGLADLLEAETEDQRRAALTASEGQVSRAIRGWMNRCALLSAQIEATIDYAEEGDVEAEPMLLAQTRRGASALRDDIARVLAAPPVERLRDGIRVVIGGPPNSGKSTLFNLMSGRDAAIVSPHAGTTRDRVEAPVTRNGRAWLLIDTAGLTDTADPVEQIGVSRASTAIADADVLIWLGDDAPPRGDALWIHSRADLAERNALPPGPLCSIRHDDATTIAVLWAALEDRGQTLVPAADQLPIKARQRDACASAMQALTLHHDPIIAAEQLRLSHAALASILGFNATESMLDALFTRFCLGK